MGACLVTIEIMISHRCGMMRQYQLLVYSKHLSTVNCYRRKGGTVQFPLQNGLAWICMSLACKYVAPKILFSRVISYALMQVDYTFCPWRHVKNLNFECLHRSLSSRWVHGWLPLHFVCVCAFDVFLHAICAPYSKRIPHWPSPGESSWQTRRGHVWWKWSIDVLVWLSFIADRTPNHPGWCWFGRDVLTQSKIITQLDPLCFWRPSHGFGLV